MTPNTKTPTPILPRAFRLSGTSLRRSAPGHGRLPFLRLLAALPLACLLLLPGCSGSDGDASAGGSESPKSGSAEWRTVSSLRSDAAPLQGMEGILVSEPFAAKGEARLVLEMPGAGQFEGLVGVIIPAEKATDARAILAAVGEGVSVTIVGAAPEHLVPDLDGTYVFVNAVPAPKPWTLEIQTAP